MNDKIVVTGGSGLVGKYLKEILPDAIYLSSKDYDLCDSDDVAKMFMEHNPDIIIHLAARVGGIIDNMERPYDYYTDNVLMNTLLLDHARQSGVERFIGILSTCIFPDKVENYPMKEEDIHFGPPTPTNFSYGYAKRSLAVQIDACNQQYGTKYQYLTPCNLYGEHDNFENDNKAHFVTALLKKIHNSNIYGEDTVPLFGTGTPLRQFMHANDLARVIAECLDKDIYESFNVATSENLSIKEIAEKALVATKSNHLKLDFDTSKPDGQFRKDVSNQKMMYIMPYFKFTDLSEGLWKTYNKVADNLVMSTINKMNISGKWAEFWTEEGGFDAISGTWEVSCKQGDFWSKVDEVDGLYQDILSNGIKGKKILWSKNGYANYKIEKVIYGDKA